MGVGHVLAARGRVNPVLATGAGGAAAKWWLGPWPGFPAAAAIDAANCVVAYRAVATVGSVWGAGPASLAESYVNLNQPGTYNATPGVAPLWDSTGWYFDGVSQYLVASGIATQQYTAIMQFSDVESSSSNRYAFGVFDTEAPTIATFTIMFVGTTSVRAYTGYAKVATNNPMLYSGNYGISNRFPYRNGIAEASVCSVDTILRLPDFPVFIGCNNSNNTPGGYTKMKIKAFVIYNLELDANQMAALGTLVTGAMAQL